MSEYQLLVYAYKYLHIYIYVHKHIYIYYTPSSLYAIKRSSAHPHTHMYTYIHTSLCVCVSCMYIGTINLIDIIKSPLGLILGTNDCGSLIKDSKTAHSLPPGHKESHNLQGGYRIVILHLRTHHSHRLSAMECNNVT